MSARPRRAVVAVITVAVAVVVVGPAAADPPGARPRVVIALGYRTAGQPDGEAGSLAVGVRLAPWLYPGVALVAGTNHQQAGLDTPLYEARAGGTGRWCDRRVRGCGLVRVDAGYVSSTISRQGSGRRHFDWSGPVVEGAAGGELRLGRVRLYLVGLVRARLGEDYDAADEKLGEAVRVGGGVELGLAVGL